MTYEDLPFQSVHDSYWTTASNVARMNYLLRKAFVEMYQHEYPEASFQIDFKTRFLIGHESLNLIG